MQWIYGIIAVIVIAVVSLVVTPILGLIVLIIAAIVGWFLFASASRGGGGMRTRPPEPTGQPRASTGGGETANQRQGQE